jgi:hypothetical protein
MTISALIIDSGFFSGASNRNNLNKDAAVKLDWLTFRTRKLTGNAKLTLG